jgi:ribosomal small subunit protein bTHX
MTPYFRVWEYRYDGITGRRYAMGKGDKRSKRGKIFAKSHGKSRPRKTGKTVRTAKAK